MDYISPPLSASQEADLLANLYYVNLHSAASTGGEIRGQLITTNPGGSGGGGGGGGTY
ncbi:CHRD domain protein [compost metagenome]